ncbi:TatD family hydrolase [Desulfovibrio sp. OttesenSCG-928-F07]|nr:TatD family hydrolase [Desulfovibrio sp. OttesenSCG-928-F07]
MAKAQQPKKEKAPAPDPASFNMPLTGVETHAHLNGKYFTEDREATLARAKAAGIARIGQVFMCSEYWRAGKDFFNNHPEVFFLLGVHPNEANRLTDEELNGIRAAVNEDKRIKALGEMGLDYYWKDVSPEVQQTAFKKQINLAKELNLPIAIHCRDAVEDTLKVLTEENCKNYPVLWHCFGGDTELALRILDMGWHISIPGTVTYPANAPMREAIKHIPLDRLVMETDCPFLPPVPHRGGRNEPAYLVFTIQTMAEAKGISAAELWTSCGQTAIKFFSLEPL